MSDDNLRKSALHLSDIARKRVHFIVGGPLGTGNNLLDRAERSSPRGRLAARRRRGV
jgi:hypothetical protein